MRVPENLKAILKSVTGNGKEPKPSVPEVQSNCGWLPNKRFAKNFITFQNINTIFFAHKERKKKNQNVYCLSKKT